ncbi:LHFPL tetraspan subfamily member 7 protein isoform X2 [Phyllopteryx taeniolatus]|uniref:LHFPL tetraspan subfamily member 7 protein isoform X2 n=1 Tax=Phyllopteryx taeniolatus TaxID=161469 RepID=UPI002AD2953E|nr:LHFPL tetraspan subfamily member 7 protein isoform X2 [Phyllopteryx taeniolatus]
MHLLVLGREKRQEKEDEEEAGCGVSVCVCVGFAPHVAATMFSCVGCFWVLLSSALVAVCSFSFISPAWIVKEQLRTNHHHHHHHHHHHNHHHHHKESVSFGLLWHCSESLDHMYRCYTFGGLGKFAEIPSSSWQTSAVLCSGGCALLAVSSLLAIITIFLPSGGCERRICTLAGYMQMAAVPSGMAGLWFLGQRLFGWITATPLSKSHKISART